MPHNRFFVDAPLLAHTRIHLPDDEWHHFKVMRLELGEKVELINGCNILAQAKVSRIEKKQVELTILSIETKEPRESVILCQALPRKNHLEWIIEKGVELGTTAFWLFPGEKSELKTLEESTLKRLRTLTISALKQCGRLDFPEIVLKPPLSQWKECLQPAYFGDLSASALPFLKALKKSEQILFFVGPESGFSQAEKEKLQALQVQGVHLHANILRAETAALVALSLIATKNNL